MHNIKMPTVEAFFDPMTYTFSYVVSDPATGKAIIVDPVLDYDPASGRTSTDSADALLAYLKANSLTLEWILETHIHADHLTSAAYLKAQVGGKVGISEHVTDVQELFGKRFNAGTEFLTDGSQFDVLFGDGERHGTGQLEFQVMETPGHTPACVTYLFDGCAFVGDTLFMPDYGTARADFPGGDARTLYRSIQKTLGLPEETLLYMCHDYGTETRKEFEHVTTVKDELLSNKFISQGVTENDFVSHRECRDAKLNTPSLLYPSIQFNMRGGQFPPAEDNGQHYFKIPVRAS